MPRPARDNRMVLLLFATGAAVGLHLGLLHLFLWRRPVALVAFVGPSFVFSGVTYALWRWVFPRLGGRTFLAQLVLQGTIALVALLLVSGVTVDVMAQLLGAPPLFGTCVQNGSGPR